MIDIIDTIFISKDGNQFMAVFADFTDLQESIAGFGDTESDAVKQLYEARNNG